MSGEIDCLACMPHYQDHFGDSSALQVKLEYFRRLTQNVCQTEDLRYYIRFLIPKLLLFSSNFTLKNQ